MSGTVTYRIPAEAFPLRFEMLGNAWELVVHPVEHGTFWTAQFEGRSRWHVAHAADEPRLLQALRVDGVQITQRTFTATLFMRLEQLRIAERVHSSGSIS
jgi:hypothetical protein